MSASIKPLLFLLLVAGVILPLAATFPGNSLYFEDGDYILGSGIPTTLTAVTLEGWVNHSDLSGSYQRYLTIGSENAVIRFNGGTQLHFYIKNSAGTLKAITANVLATGEWLHVAGTYDGTTMKLYLNGNQVATTNPSPAGFASCDGTFGISRSGEAMHGYLDDFRFWTVARTQQQIKDNRFVQLSGSETGLRSYWRMDSSSGTTCIDDKGNSNGTMYGMSNANWVASGVPTVGTTAGNAISFDGVDDIIDLKTRNGLPIWNNGTGNAYSVSMWIKGNPQNWKRIYTERNDTETAGVFQIVTTSDGKLQVDIRPYASALWLMQTTTTVVLDNEWHHIAWVDNNGTAKFYIDGMQDASNFNYTRGTVTANRVAFGGFRYADGSVGSFFNGQMDEISLWNFALSATQVSNYMSTYRTGTEAGLNAYFQCNESTGDVLYDVAKGNNGIMSNMSDVNRVPSEVYAGPTFSGTISSNTTWSGSNLYITGDVTVNNGVTLTINPGLVVRFNGAYKMNVQGRLLAVGTPADSIIFTSGTINKWKGIRFDSTPATNDSSKIKHCIVKNASSNASTVGGAVYCAGFDKLVVSFSRFSDNTSLEDDGVWGGGAICYASCEGRVYDCLFTGNYAVSNGGAICMGNGSLFLERCIFLNNHAGDDGGAVYTAQSAWVRQCVFRGNVAGGKGGGYHNYWTGSTYIYNGIFDANQATQGGGISMGNGHLDVTNCTLINNTATTGGGLCIAPDNDPNYTKIIRNIVLWGNSATNGSQVALINAGTVDFQYCDIQNGQSGFYGTHTGTYSNCWTANPQITYSTSNPGSGYALGTLSPCINAGNPSTVLSGPYNKDVNGSPRMHDNTTYTGNLDGALDRIDCGAIEDQGSSVIIGLGTILTQNHTIQTDMYLLGGQTLTINPSVTLSFAPDAHFNVSGSLTAVGTVSNRITFTESVSGSKWRGITFSNDASSPGINSVMEYCTIEKGQADTGNEEWGGNIHAWYYPSLTIRKCIIRDGYAYIGGAVYSRGSTISVINSVISENVCTSRGPGLYCNSGVIKVINCTVSGNYKTGSQSTASYLAPIYFNNIGTQPVIRNCIVYGNNTTAPMYAESGSLTNVSYCNIEGGYTGTGNINVNPYFTGETNNPYNIERYSFCTNAGIPDTTGLNLSATDIMNNPRIYSHNNTMYNRVDMGAYEYQGLHAPGPFSATDGNNDYPGYVRLEWNYNPDYNVPVSGFKIYRNGIHYETLSNEYLTYSDYNVIPGTIYTYIIMAYYNAETGDSYPDEGYIKPNGIISGNIKTANNNPVMGVKITLNPSVGRCLYLNATNSSSISIPNPNADMNSNFTLELWVNTNSQNVNLFNSGSHNLMINASGLVQYTDGISTLIQQDTSVDANDADWHHIAIVNDFTNNRVLMYLDDLVAASSSDYLFANYTPSGFEIPAGLTGYVDDLRIWEAARDSSEIVDAMNIVVPYDSPGLKGYWAMNEGTGNSVYDATNNSVNGSAVSCTWSSADPGIAVGAITNAWGEYVITQISYGSATTFAVTPIKAGHMFQPEQRLITLSNSNIAADGVNFTDNSMIPISGHVKFQSTIVPVVGAVIYLNGSPALPRIVSDDDGYYVLEVEHGTQTIVSVEYNGHPFNRTWNLGTVTYPRININFEDILRTEFKLDVVGGQDSYPIGEFDVSVSSVDGLYTKEVTGQNWSSGSIMVANIPPLEYNVTVDPGAVDPFGLLIDDQFQAMKTQHLDMRTPDETLDTLRYEWRAPLQVEVSWPDSLDSYHFNEYPENEFYVLTQNVNYSVLVKACEDYSWDGHPDQKSYLNDCQIVINDEVSPYGVTETALDGETEFTYVFAPYLPNIQSGYDRQYQKIIEFTASDEALNRFSTQSDWVLTQGVKPLESTFATTTPQIPFLVLHDPPGDSSYSSFNQTSSHSTSIGIGICVDQENSSFINLHLGPDLSLTEGFAVFYVNTVIDVVADMSWEWTTTVHQENSFEQTYTFTTSTEYQTSSSDDIIGDFGGDVFVGGAMNLIWGITNEVYWDYDGNDVNIVPNLMVSPNGFATRYIYTESQIVNTVIPNLYAIGDTESADLWQSFLDNNDYNKSHALPNSNHPGNVSFSAGPEYTYTEETSALMSHTLEFETTFGSEFTGDWGLLVDGVGVDGGIRVRTEFNIGHSVHSEFETTSTTTFVLADDDVASDLTFNSDYFTVDIGQDPVYGTPTFNLISGASSCHWEPNTQPRDGVMMTANTYTASGIPEGQPAVFLLYLSNTSQSNEPRRYYLEAMHATNDIGALVKVNGIPLATRMAFDLDAGQTVTAVLTVEQGLFGYELQDLVLEFYAEGDRGYDGPTDHYFDIFKSFNVFWEAPFSRVSILSPQDNWIVNQACEDTLRVTFTDYDLNKPDFKSIKLEYKRPSQIDWMPAFEIMRSELEDNPRYIEHAWDVSSLSDGLYQIRAATTDSVQANWYTAHLSGVIDRSAPVVWGIPQPADGILQLGDLICLSFNESIDPLSLLPGRVEMIEVGGLLAVDCNIQCNEASISIVPNISNYWMENKTLKVSVHDLTDLYGNPMAETVEWEFFVNANPVYWQTSKIELIKPLGQSYNFSTTLINSGGQMSSFSMIDLPAWLTANPMTGILMPLDSETISFGISSQLGFGTFRDTLYADIPGLGKEPLILEVRVLADPPQWTSTLNFNYDHTMTIIGQMMIDGIASEDQNDIIGAFIMNGAGDYECRGVANTQYVDLLGGSYQFFLTVHSDEEYGEDLILRVWDASSCKDYFGVEEEFVFASGANYGTPITPEAIHPEGQLIKEMSLSPGWTWISTNLLDAASMSTDSVLASLSPNLNDIIKGQTQYAQYTDGAGWLGSLAEISNTSMYKIKLADSDQLVLTGDLRDPDSSVINYGSGWNWIGYIPHVSIGIGEALGNAVNLENGDMIKSQHAFAQYISGSGWYGSLRFMNPGEGYMLKTAQAGSFSYPDYQIPRGFRHHRDPDPIPDIPGWDLNPLAYEFSANITGVIQCGDLILNDEFVIGAFVGTECRGIAAATEVLGSTMYFLTLYSNTYSEPISFRVYDAVTQTETALPNSVIFLNNQVIGTPLDPYAFLMPLSSLEAPKNLRLEKTTLGALLSWDPVPGAQYYNIWITSDPQTPFESWTLHNQVTGVTLWLDSEVNEHRFYRVSAGSVLAREPVPAQEPGEPQLPTFDIKTNGLLPIQNYKP